MGYNARYIKALGLSLDAKTPVAVLKMASIPRCKTYLKPMPDKNVNEEYNKTPYTINANNAPGFKVENTNSIKYQGFLCKSGR